MLGVWFQVEVLKEQQAKRIKLDIVLRSPVITAPSSSTSTSSVRVNLGVLTVKNDLSLVDDSDAKVLLDTMAVAMTDVSVTRYVPLLCIGVLLRLCVVECGANMGSY